MELPSKILEKTVFKTRLKIEEHMLVVVDKSTQEENKSQRLQFHIKQFQIVVTFPTDKAVFFGQQFKINCVSERYLLIKTVSFK